MRWSPNEAELVEMTLASAGHQLLQERLDAREKACLAKLRNPDTGQDAVNILRGQLLAIEFMRTAFIQNEINHHENVRNALEEARTHARS